MRRFGIILGIIFALSGCTTNGVYDAGKTWTLVGAVAITAVAVSADDGPPEPVRDPNLDIAE